MKKEKVAYIQVNFGYGWEDLSGYPFGYRQKNRSEQLKNAKHDIKEYRESGCGVYRLITRYENME